LEEGQPYLQIGDITLEGEVDETLGTHLFFEVEERAVETSGLGPLLQSMRTEKDDDDNNDTNTPKQQKYTLKYDCKTDNIIKTESVSLKPKQDLAEQDTRETKDDGAVLDAVL
jgi:hypothetical protein